MPDPTAGAAELPETEFDAEARRLRREWYKAEAQQAIADANKAVAEANAAAASAGLYKRQTETVKGETQLDESAGSLVRLVALRALTDVAGKVADDIDRVLEAGHEIVIVPTTSVALTDAPFQEITQRLAWFAAEFEQVGAPFQPAAAATDEPPPAPQPAAAAPLLPLIAGAITHGPSVLSAVGMAADLVAMLKTNYSVAGRAVTIDQTSLAALVARRLVARGIHVTIEQFRSLDSSSVLSAFNALLASRWDLDRVVAEVDSGELSANRAEIDSVTARLDAARLAYDKAKLTGADASAASSLVNELRGQLTALQQAAYLNRVAQVAAARALIAAFDAYVTLISTVPEGQEYPPLFAAALAERLHQSPGTNDAMDDTDYILYLGLSASAGDATTRTGLFTNNDRVGLIGAVHVTHLLATPLGRVVASGSFGAYSAANFKLGDNRLQWAPPSQ